jgi:hypothetical protein
MGKRRTLLILKASEALPGGGLPALGSLKDVIAMFGAGNVAPDGAGTLGLGDRPGSALFHGPGLVAEVPLDPDQPNPDVKQILVGVTDDDFAWPVLSRLCKTHGWKLMDPDSGRTFLG